MSKRPRCHECKHPKGIRIGLVGGGKKGEQGHPKKPCGCDCHI